MESHDRGHRPDHGAGIVRDPLPIFLRLRALFRRRQLDQDLEDELAFHLAMRAEKLGDPAAAQRQFGNVTSFKEICRDMWTFTWLETFLQDLKFAIRQLRMHPGFTVVAALTLAVGIGATTSIYSMMNTVLWEPQTWVRPERLTVIQQVVPGEHVGDSLTPADQDDIRRSITSLESLTAWNHSTVSIVDASGEALRVEMARVEPNFFDVVGVQPVLGRAFQKGEDQPGGDHVVIMSDDLWRRHFGASPFIDGTPMRINGETYTIVGVMPAKFHFPGMWRQLWIPLSLPPEMRASRTHMSADAAGRLKRGVTLRQFDAELKTIGERLERDHPDTNKGRRFSAWTLNRYQGGDYLPVYTSMAMCAAFFVLLIACVNVANLQFARATGRWREVAVRTALGAGRSRIVRQLITESLVLAVAATALALLLARWALVFVKSGVPEEMRRYMPTWNEIGLNPRAFWVSLGAALLSGLLAGLLPAWRCSRPNLNDALKEGSRSSGGPGRHRLRTVLAAAEIAMAVVLLVGAALMVRSFRGMISGQPNLKGSSLLTLRLQPEGVRYREQTAIAAFYRELLDRVRQMPAVSAAAVGNALPYSRMGESWPLTIEGQEPKHGKDSIVMVETASADYFRLLDIPLRAGRLLRDADTAGAPHVVLISESLARRWFPGEPASSLLGKQIRLGPATRPLLTIAGVVGDIHQSAMERAMQPIAYVSYLQSPVRSMNVAVRTTGDAMRLGPAITAAVRAVDREQPIENLATLDTLLHQEVFVFQYMAWMMGIFGAVALTLGVVGIYGVMSYVVSQQTHDIGVRIALGATRGRVMRSILRRGMMATGIGLVVGLIPAFGLARLLAFAVWSVHAADAGTFVGIPLLLALAAGVATYIPARRAVRVDPIAALREE